MPYKKLKDENYNNLGGINVKASDYMTANNQFLDLRNYCFERIGALQSRHGTSDFLTLAKSTYGATPSTIYQWDAPNFRVGVTASAASSLVSTSFIIWESGGNLYADNGQTTYNFDPSLTAGRHLDFASEQRLFPSQVQKTADIHDLLYYANGVEYKVFSRPDGSVWGFTQGIGAAFPTTEFSTLTSLGYYTVISAPETVIPSGTHAVKVAFGKLYDDDSANRDAVFSEVSSSDSTLTTAYFFVGSTQVSTQRRGLRLDGIEVPQGYGYSLILPFYKAPGDSEFRYLDPNTGQNISITGTPFYDSSVSLNGIGSLVFFPFTTSAQIPQYADISQAPRYLESYKNMLFMAGFSSSPSELKHSAIGDFQNYQTEYRIFVSEGDGQDITNMSKFQDALVIFKEDSIYELTGYSPETLSLKTITREYGCPNNRASVKFGNKLWFVDRKGIAEYNGPNTFIVSYAVEDYFFQLDYTKMVAFHVKADNQVWFCEGGVCLVYDYNIAAWTIYDNFPISTEAGAGLVKNGNTLASPAWVTSGESFFNLTSLDRSVNTDRGEAITLIAKTRYHKRMGDTTQEMWRRVFFDADAVTTSIGVTMNMRADYGTLIADTKSIDLGAYQSRVDFGVSAKSLSVEFIIQSDNLVTFNGYTVESRFLRST